MRARMCLCVGVCHAVCVTSFFSSSALFFLSFLFIIMIINLSYRLEPDDSCVLLHTNLQTTPTGHDRCKRREAGDKRRGAGVKKARFFLFCFN